MNQLIPSFVIQSVAKDLGNINRYISVIQTTEGRKDLGNTHFMLPRFFTPFNNTSSLRFTSF